MREKPSLHFLLETLMLIIEVKNYVKFDKMEK